MRSGEIVYLEYSDIRLYLDTISNQFKFEIKIRDENALKSAFNTPKNSYNNNLYQIAFSYAKYFSLDHPLVDGNKRVAYALCIIFLRLNGKKHKLKREKFAKLFIKYIEKKNERNIIEKQIIYLQFAFLNDNSSCNFYFGFFIINCQCIIS